MTRALGTAIIEAAIAAAGFTATFEPSPTALVAVVEAAVAAARFTGALRIATLRGSILRRGEIASTGTTLRAPATATSAATSPAAAPPAITAAVVATITAAISSAEVRGTTVVALRISLRGIVLMPEILRRGSVGFRLALVFGRNFLIAGLVARRGLRSGLGMKLFRSLIVRFTRSFKLASVGVLGFFVSRFGDIEMRALAVGRVRPLVGAVRMPEGFTGQQFHVARAGGRRDR